MRCFRCIYLNWDFLSHTIVSTSDYFCGLHGRCSVDPKGPQINLDRHGSCGFVPKSQPIQLTINFEF